VSIHRVVVEDERGVRLVAFDRPDVRNAFDAAMYDAVSRALSEALDDEAVRAVVLTGRGPVFTSGQDLREMAVIAEGSLGEGAGSGFRNLLDLLGAFDKPLLAAVHGVGVGLGCTLLPHVDLVLVEEGTRLRVPFAELGVPPEAASSVLLPARSGSTPTRRSRRGSRSRCAGQEPPSPRRSTSHAGSPATRPVPPDRSSASCSPREHQQCGLPASGRRRPTPRSSPTRTRTLAPG
jgi:hypothetical protein